MNQIIDIQLPTISLITCAYQHGRFLDATLRSVLDQEYPALEYIIIDGGSTDGSIDIIQKHADQLAYWVSEKDQGQTDALIKGFEHSSGEIMGWLCSDDLLLQASLQTVGQFFATHPEVDVVYGDALWIDEIGRYVRAKKEIGFNRSIFLFDHNYIPQPSLFWRRRIFNTVQGLDRDFDLAMDYDLFERFSRNTKIKHIPAYLSAIRSYAAQKTQCCKIAGGEETALIRARSPLGRYIWLYPVLHKLAQMSRILAKVAASGYHASPTATLLKSVEQYRLPA